MPEGWDRAASGVELRGKEFSTNPAQWGFNLSGRSLQLVGIANAVKTPLIPVAPNQGYCFVGRALTDSEKQSATRLRVVFEWLDASGAAIANTASDWQPVPLWTETSRSDWGYIRAAGTAPATARNLRVSLHPSSDDRIYLDLMHVRRVFSVPASPEPPDSGVQIMPWPRNAKAAVSFTFDWETAMGGLIHTRSNQADDPNSSQDWQLRALRMRDGITTTLDLFRPYGIRATYYATGYNFLRGNTEQRMFMGNPTYAWASPENGWPQLPDQPPWNQRPWFSDDPFRTFQEEPAWYFGDLIPRLQAEQQDIQTHTFAHFAGTYVKNTDWQADFAAWRAAAAPHGLPAPRSLAFPWSSSNGMSDDDWNALAANGITSVTRLHWSQAKSALFAREQNGADGIVIEPRCRPIPGHETILGCPDFYLHDGSALTATQQIDRAIAAGGMIDLWAHTEEVTSPSQIQTWSSVVRYAAAKRDQGQLWIAPLSEVADWQQALALVRVGTAEATSVEGQQAIRLTVENTSDTPLAGLTIGMAAPIQRASAEKADVQVLDERYVVLDLPARQTIELVVWPAGKDGIMTQRATH
ncbi:MAG: polysaccharide deacetylase family protein [Roseiflexaceae bacterium]